jgi:hypothetical protein
LVNDLKESFKPLGDSGFVHSQTVVALFHYRCWGVRKGGRDVGGGVAVASALQAETVKDREDCDEGLVATTAGTTVEELAVVVISLRRGWWQRIRCRAMPSKCRLDPLPHPSFAEFEQGFEQGDRTPGPKSRRTIGLRNEGDAHVQPAARAFLVAEESVDQQEANASVLFAHGSEVSESKSCTTRRGVRFLLSQKVVVVVQGHWVESMSEINASYALEDSCQLGRDDS